METSAVSFEQIKQDELAREITAMLDQLVVDYSLQARDASDSLHESIPHRSAGNTVAPLQRRMVQEALSSGTVGEHRMISAALSPVNNETQRLLVDLIFIDNPHTRIMLFDELNALATAVAQWQPELNGRKATPEITVHFIREGQEPEIFLLPLNREGSNKENEFKAALTGNAVGSNTTLEALLSQGSLTNIQQTTIAILQEIESSRGITILLGETPTPLPLTTSQAPEAKRIGQISKKTGICTSRIKL